MNRHSRTPTSRSLACELFAQAVDGSRSAFDGLVERAEQEPEALDALTALLVVECEGLERAGRLEEPSVAVIDQILAAVRDAASSPVRAAVVEVEMVHPAEVKRREKRAILAVRMSEAAACLRAHGEAGDGFAGLDAPAADAVAELIEAIGAGARGPVNLREWEIAARLTESILQPVPPAPPGKPLPTGYSNPALERNDSETFRRPGRRSTGA